MYTDLYGRKRMKIGLHIHTNVTDGRESPEKAAEIYKEAGYDAVVLSDHWAWRESGEINGLRIISGAEYNNQNDGTYKDGFGNDATQGVFHILGIGAKTEPKPKSRVNAQHFIDAIHEAGGIAILAHPAWSLNSVEQVKALSGFDATEIYNTVSGVHASNRAYSGAIVDMLANEGIILPLTAADDTHYYDNDCAVSYIMADVTGGDSDDDILNAVKSRNFYATQGPEIHIKKNGDGTVSVRCSTVSFVSFYSNSAFNPKRNVYGEDIIMATYTPSTFEKWVRAEVTDKDGKRAWSNIILL